MASMHIKGFILQKLLTDGPLWDYELVEAVKHEYTVSGEYWTGTVRLTLTDLYSGGLLDQLDTASGAAGDGDQQKILFRYQVNSFGRKRMEQSGILEASR